MLTVLKAGFLGSGGFGSGLVVARLSDGSWSAPSAVGTLGGGFGGQIGFELTDFVFILNDASAVKTFAQLGSITLGGNVSIAAGPVGRNAEAAGAASVKSLSGVFAYSKTKGLFAGVSLEGKIIVERRDANEKMYGRAMKAAEILRGGIPPPPQAEPLLRVLNSRAFSGGAGSSGLSENMYNDIPIYSESHENVIWQGKTGSAMGEGQRRDRSASNADDEYEYRDSPRRTNTWADPMYDSDPVYAPPQRASTFGRANPSETFDQLETRNRSSSAVDDNYVYSDQPGSKPKPGRPTAPKPVFNAKPAALSSDKAIAKFTFDADQPGDLSFKKGDIITIIKRTEKESDWWTGKLDGKEGVFPR